MYLKFKAIIAGFIISIVLFPVLGYFSFIVGGLLAGYLVADDYIDGAINGAISAASGGLIIVIFLLFIMAKIFGAYSGYGETSGLVYVSFIYTTVQILVAGLFMGGLGGFAGIFIREQIEMRNSRFSGGPPKNKDNGYLVCNACSGYYKLQEGESPDDFDTNCECGGVLEHTENISQKDGPHSDSYPQNGKKGIRESWSQKSTPIKALILVGVLFLGVVVVSGAIFFGTDNGFLADNVSLDTTPLTGDELEAYKASCKEVNVKELINNPDKYKGQRVKFTGVTYQVFDVNMIAERNEEDAYTILVGPTTNIDNPVDNPIFVIYKNGSSIEQLNIVTVYGDVYGSIDRAGVESVTRINGRYIEVVKNREEVIEMI